MADDRFAWISKRAYAIWEAAGRPSGCDQEHWKQAAAERDIMERSRASVDGEELLLRFRQKATPPSPDQALQAEDGAECIMADRIS